MVDDVIRRLGYLALGTRLKRLGERLQADTQRILDERALAIQTAQFPFLVAIDLLGPSTVGDLADAIGVSQPGATRTLGALAASGYVAITTASDDQWRRLVALTAKGAQLVEIGKRELWPLIDAAVRDLCTRRAAPLLDQLTAIEDELGAASLDHRVAALRAPAPPRRARRPTARAAAGGRAR